MDIREVKTKRNITNSFLELRSKKPLEKITIKELAEKAEISKATFYLHYHDIYELSEQLQQEVILKIIDLVEDPDAFLNDMVAAHRTIQDAFIANKSLINILFSDSQESALAILLERELKNSIFKKHPEFKSDAALNAKFSFFIMGSFYAYLHNSKNFPPEEVANTISTLLGVF